VYPFESECGDWMFDHPTELRFIFYKTGCFGWDAIKDWDVSDCLQFKVIKNVDVKIEEIDYSQN
jgi:hypothetical protein